MAVLQSLLTSFRQSRTTKRKSRLQAGNQRLTEALEDRLLLTNPDPFESNPGATKTIYLDFDGHAETSAAWDNVAILNRPVTNPAFSLDADLNNFSLDERVVIEEIFLRVAEDFAPFENINVTTVEPGSFAPGDSLLISIGGSGIWSPRSQNHALVDGFTVASLSTTQHVFPRDFQSHPATSPAGRNGEIGRDVAGAVSEVAGIAFGLIERNTAGSNIDSHLVGSSSFALGLRDTWDNSDTVGPVAQDDLAVITKPANTINFVADDHGDDIASATAVATTANVEMIGGVIGSDTDVDVFAFSTEATTATFSARGLDLTSANSSVNGAPFTNVGVTNPGSNLDIELRLYDANGNQIAMDDPPATAGDNDSIAAEISVALPAGNYYLEVSGGGRYGSLGQYTVTMTGVDQPTALGAPPQQSNPAAPVTFFLDFNGHVVSNPEILAQRADGINQPFYVPAYDTDGDRTSFSAQEEAEISEIWARVAEDFAPFDVNVTTFDPFVFNNQQGLLVAIGGDGSWYAGPIGPGFAEPGTFGAGTGDNNAVLFGENLGSPKETALEASALIGVTLGIEPYIDHAGGGGRIVGAPALGPIGGDSVGSLREAWRLGEGLTQGVIQDPLALINSAANRISYRADDHGDGFTTATIINVTTADEVLTGIIGENDDEDWFSFQTLAANATLSVTGLDLTVDTLGNPTGITNPGANLDPVLELFHDIDGNGSLVSIAIDGDFPPTLNLNDGDPASLKAGFTVPIEAGLYYLRVATRGGLAEYGNLGQYTVTIQDVDGTPAVLSFTPDPNDPSVTSIAENAGVVVGVGRVDRPFGQPNTAPLVVNLVSTDTTELMVPAQVTIPPGQSFVNFDVTAVDDNILDGEQNVIVEAYVMGVLNSTAILKVADHETISASVNPNPVKENAGAAGATLTVTRSNTDIGQANHWAASGAVLEERDPAGNVVRSVPIEWPPAGVRPVAEVVRDIHVMQDGNVAVYNGTGQAFLSIFNVTTGTWRHFAEPGLSGSNIDPTVGGLTTTGDYVFLTDIETFDGDPRGIVRVNTVTGQIDRFADSSVGSRLYVLTGTTVTEINAVTGEVLNTITPQPTLGAFNELEAIAFDGQDLWVLFDNGGGFGGGGAVRELQKLNADSGAVLEIHSVPLPASSFFTFFDDIGMTTLNGLIYFNVPIDSGFTTARAMQAYDPSDRQLEGGALPFESLNNIIAGSNIGTLKGDGTAQNPDVLLVHGYPDVFGGSTFDDRIYMLDPETGRVIDSFVAGTFLGFFIDGGGIGGLDDVIIGNTVRNGLIYLNTNDGIHVFDRNGARVDVNPMTAIVDPVPHADPFSFDFNELAAADVPGVSAQELSYRDVTIGVGDNLLYGLVENGSEVTVYDPETLVFIRTIQLDSVVNAISVDEDGNIFGGGSNGDVRYFDADGNTIATLNTTSLGLATVADVDTNISEEIIVSDVNGVVITGPRQAVFDDDASMITTDVANTTATTFSSFGRHGTLPTGPLVVTLTSDDVSELMTPLEVTIPVGQPSATVYLDVIDDNELDGPQTVTIAGDAANYVPDATQVIVQDAESVGVEVQRDTTISVLDSSLLSDGDRIELTINDKKTIFEIEDTSVADGIRPSSGFAINMDLGAGVTNAQAATAIAQAISLANVGVTATPNGDDVILSGNPYFPSARLILTDAGAANSEKRVAEIEGVLPGKVRVFRTDVNGPFTVPASTGGSVGTPLPIDDNAVTLSQITIEPQVSRVTDINVNLSLQHEFLPDLDVTLVSPSGTRVRLFADMRSNESGMTNTTLDDEAGTRIIDGNAPFTGSFIPEQLLANFDGEDPSGVWTLEIVDDNVTDDGVLLNWSIDIETLGISETQVTLVTSDGTEASVTTQTVTIPAARSEVYVDLTAIDDSIVDGTIPVNVGVAASNLGGVFDLGSDVVDITDVETLQLVLDTYTVSEGAGVNAIMGTITRSDTDMSAHLTVNFSSSDTSELDVPASVTIPMGQPSATFFLDAVDDLQFDGDQQVVVTATATGYMPVTSDVVTVTDQEPRLVMTTLTPVVYEDDGTLIVTISRLDASDLSFTQQIQLSSSDLTELIVPTNIEIAAGETSTTFTAMIQSDDLLDGPQTVTITAADVMQPNRRVNTGTLDIQVLDSEKVEITVPVGAESFLENAGVAAVTATVSITSEPQANDLIVTLTNGDRTEIRIPAQVVIPAGQTSVTFDIDAIDDSFVDRAQLVTITGSAAGYLDGVLNVTVRDHEPPILLGPELVTEDSTPEFRWAPVDKATRYDLWVNDVSRNINQLFRVDNIQPQPILFYEDFEAEFLDLNSNRIFDPSKWQSTAGSQVDMLSLNDPTGSYSAHLNGDPNGGDILQSRSIDLSGLVGAQLRFEVQRTGGGESPETGDDLVLSYRDASGVWRQLNVQTGQGPDMDLFQTVILQLPEDALHDNFAFRFHSIGQNEEGDVPGAYDDWFIDRIEIAAQESYTPLQSIGVGRYRFWVRAYDDREQPGAWSAGRTIQVRTRPQITSPANGSTQAEASFPEISWTTIVDTAYYDLWVNNVTTGESQVIRETMVPTTSFDAVMSDLPGGTYRAWVRAHASDGFAGYWSRPTTFSVLTVPQNITPNSATFDRTPKIEWDPVEGAANYYVWLTLRNPGEDAVVMLRDRFVPQNYRIPESDLPSGRYAVWVKAIAADGTESAWSAAQEFYIGGRPEIMEPVSGSTTSATPIFQWSGIDGAVRYEFWVNRIDQFQSRVVYDADVQATSYAVQSSLQPGTYRAWVRAFSDMGEASEWSQYVEFTVASAELNSEDELLPQATESLLTRLDLTAEAQSAVRYVVSPLIVDDQMEQPVAVRVQAAAEPAATPVAEEVIDAEEEKVLDDVLADWSATENWVMEAPQSEEEPASAALGAGLGLLASGSVLSGTRRRRRRSS